MYQVLLTDEGEKNNRLVAALEQLGKVETRRGLLVCTGDMNVLAVLESLEGAVNVISDEQTMKQQPKEKRTYAHKPRCMKCNIGNAGKDGICTTCRQKERRNVNNERTERRIEAVVLQAKENGTLNAVRVG
jgi:hypothetical protein